MVLRKNRSSSTLGISKSPSEVEGASGGDIDSDVPCITTSPAPMVPSTQMSTLPAASDLLDSNMQQFFASNRSDRFAMRYTVLNWPRARACARQASSAMLRQRKVSLLLSGLRETIVWLSKHLCTSATSGTSHASSGSGDMLGCLPQVMHASRSPMRRRHPRNRQTHSPARPQLRHVACGATRPQQAESASLPRLER
eukprot:scaffold33626_cov67-Phaeocystis_antarctica.AAC.2